MKPKELIYRDFKNFYNQQFRTEWNFLRAE